MRSYLDARIAAEPAVTEANARQFYESERARFQTPPRFRARHIFVAAPAGTAPDVMLAKRSVAQALSIRRLAGEAFEDLAVEASEDNNTKDRGGDLGWFSAARMPPDFIAEVQKLASGQTSGPRQTHLGFHIIELTDTKPARELTFEEAREEIFRQLANEHRAARIALMLGELRPQLIAAAPLPAG